MSAVKKLGFTNILFFLVLGFSSVPLFAWEGMPTPPLQVEGRFLKDPDGNNVVLRGGWMQPTETWFNGGGGWYSNPTDWTDPNDVAGLLNYLKGAATLMSDTSPKYGRDHGWYASFVRVNTDSIGGWTQASGLVDPAQFDGWIQNFLVPYANHLKARGLYLVLSATGPINTPNNGSQNAGVTEQGRLRTFWSTVANAPGVKNADNIMFELMNEPVEIESSPGNGDWGLGQPKYYSAFRDWIQPVIDDIRHTGANNVIWVPTLEWQGSPQQHLQYPFSDSNAGVAVHYYPAYGACYDNVECHNNLWNEQYQPVADLWPMIITENFWFPENDGLVGGSTANYGNTLKANIDAAGNVSYMVGFLSDLLELETALPANASLSSKEGAQAAFSWFYQDNRCASVPVTAYAQVNDGSWQQTSSVTVNAGDQVRFGPQPVSGGSWSWSGCETSGSSREQTVYPAGSCTAVATYTSTCGAQSTQNFDVTVSGGLTFNGTYSFVAQHSGSAIEVADGGTSNGTNVQQGSYGASGNSEIFQVSHLGDGWHRISPVSAPGLALDVSGGETATADGDDIHIWTYHGGNNQLWRFDDSGSNHVKIIARHSAKCLDISGASTVDGANILQWECRSDAPNQAFQMLDVGTNSNSSSSGNSNNL